MLILDQEREKICKLKDSLYIFGDRLRVDGHIVATYKTYQRCQEVLEDIIKKAEVGCNTYIMPEE